MRNDDYIYDKSAIISLSASSLKIIAMITMVIDHIGYLILNGKLYGFNQAIYQHVITLPEAQKWIIMYNICRTIGRLSFPIFGFLIVEGLIRTSNRLSYVLRLLVLAIVSEIPFDLMISNHFLYLNEQNVVFMYAMMVGLISIYKRIGSKPVFMIILTIIGMTISYFVKISYGPLGVFYIAYIYNTKNDKTLRTVGCGVISFIMSLYKNRYGFGALSAVFIHLYNGKKGNIKLGRLPYILYPLHMMIIVIIVYISYKF